MTSQLQKQTAKIYQFPLRGRMAPQTAVERLEAEFAALPVPATDFGSGWYHDAAIEDEHAASRWPAKH